MELYTRIATTIIFSGAFFTLIMAVEQLVVRNRSGVNVLGFFVILCNAVFNLNIGLAAAEVQVEHPWTAFLFITALYLSGPLNYLYSRAILGEGNPMPPGSWKHLALPAAVFVSELGFLLLPSSEQRFLMSAVFDPGSVSFIKVGVVAGALLIVAYHTTMMRELLMVRDSRNARAGADLVIILNFSGVIAAILLLYGFLSGIRWLLIGGGIAFVFLNIMVFLSHSRNPELFLILKREIRDRKYRKSMLNGVDVEALHGQLVSLMEEGLYRDYELTRASLAELLGITPHQLSQFMNERLNTTFSNFVNRYRVEEAIRLLGTEEGRNVLSVCYHVGFNSKSAFNAAFKRLTGSMPRHHRPGRGETADQ